jgi:protein phosphatase
VNIAAFGQSDVGLVRANNEDSFSIVDLTTGATAANGSALNSTIGECGNLLMVADGMGGGEAGEVASRMAVDLVARHFIDQLSNKRPVDQGSFVEALKQSVREANRVVFQEGQRNGLRGMGTTLTAAAVHGKTIFFAQLGDSRAYLVRNNLIAQMTRDQSLVAQLVVSGSITPEEARTHPQRNVILQALGVHSEVGMVISFADLKRGDQLVICSDGLSGKMEPEEIKEFLERSLEPKAACHQMVELARERGGEDNITVIVARFDGDGLPPPDRNEKLVYDGLKEHSRWRFWPWSRS